MTGSVVLQFSTTPARSSLLIRAISHSPFSHVDLVLPDGNLLGASDSPDAPVIEGNCHGVAVRPPDYEEFQIRRRAVIQTPVADAIVAAARSQLGKPFDNTALYEFLGPITSDELTGWRDPDSWFCSELIAWSFERGNYWGEPLLWPKERISPTDLVMIFQMDKNFLNRATFWDDIPGIKLGVQEQ